MQPDTNWWNTLKDEGAVYECPKDKDGKRLGPLVIYAGKDENQQHFVGDIYLNFAVIERRTALLKWLSEDLVRKFPDLIHATAFCGVPEGGKAFATIASLVWNRPYIYPDQEVVEGTKSKKLTFMRHEEAVRGQKLVLFEDVLNNFSTTADLIRLVAESGGEVIALASVLNRSTHIGDSFQGIPICSVIRKPLQQFRQSDPEVAADIAAGNIAFEPKKKDWSRLMAAMAAA